MPNTFSTLEGAQAEIIRLNEQLTAAETERDTLRETNMNLTGELERVRNLNQQYFLKLSQQFVPAEPEPAPMVEHQSCEDFAKTLEI